MLRLCYALLVRALLMFLVFGGSATADDSIKPVVISAGRIPHVFDIDQPGAYNKVLDLMARDLPRPLDIRYFPLTSAMRQLAADDYHCFAMALKSSPNWARLGMDASEYTFIGPIAWLEIKAYVRVSDAGGDEATLSGKSIVADGTILNLRSLFDENWASADIKGADSFVDALDALVAGQASVALAYDVDVHALGPDHRLHGQFVDTGVTIANLQDGVMCKSTLDMLPVILGLQEGLDKISADGTLGRLLAEPDN